MYGYRHSDGLEDENYRIQGENIRDNFMFQEKGLSGHSRPNSMKESLSEGFNLYNQETKLKR